MNFWLRDAKKYYGEKVALIYNQQKLTYNILQKKVIKLAKKLPYKKRVGLYIDNSLESVILIHALIERGIEMVMINTRLAAKEISKQLKDVEVDTIITTCTGDNLYELVELNILSLDAIHNFKPIDYKNVAVDQNSILSIMFTSGTTGRAKAVTQSYLNHYASHKNAQLEMEYTSESTWLIVNPIFHISGFSIIMRAVITGCTLIIHNKFNSKNVLKDIEKYKITHTSFVPIMLSRLMQNEFIDTFNISSLKGILMGGANTTPKLLKQAISFNLPVFNSFGMTETCSQIVIISYKDQGILTGTVGQVNDNIKLNTNNELLVKGDSVTNGYLNAQLLLEDGYFNTGDIAEIKNNYLYIMDRRDDLIISGGENIYPKEIEDIVLSHSHLDVCVVVKRESIEWGQVPVLLIENNHSISDNELKNIFNQYLARYKHPKDIQRVEKILYTPTGKISRKLNRETYL